MRQHHSSFGAPAAPTLGVFAAVPLLLVLLSPAGFAQSTSGRAPLVAAASDLNFALTDLAADFARAHGVRVELVFGSSGLLTRQILDGAPFELFLSADEPYIDQVVAAGLARDRGVPYAIGRLVLFAPNGSPLSPAQGLDGLSRLVASGRVTRFAIANPAHAPYGRAAERTLRKHGLWDRLQPALVLGDNVSQAAQFATTGGAVGGLIAYSLAVSPAMNDRGSYALIPSDDHPPLVQRMVRLGRSRTTIDRFYEYLQQPAARAVFERYGFALPPR